MYVYVYGLERVNCVNILLIKFSLITSWSTTAATTTVIHYYNYCI